ncbi:MAG: phytanoyl-CoA dioxygenase family protein [Tagaea sp.]
MEFEIDRPEAAAEHIRATGSAVLRGAWPMARLAPFRAAVLDFCERRRARVRAGQARPHEKMFDTHGVGTISAMEMEGCITCGYFVGLFSGSAYEAICRRYFGDSRLYTHRDRNGFRYHRPGESDRSFIPYHQDSYTQDPRVASVLNCWVALDPAGVDAPGLEVVRHVCSAAFPRREWGIESANAAYDGITIERARILEVYGDNFAAPAFAPGDALIFSEHVIHRTHVLPGMTKSRVNMEFRVFSESACRDVPGMSPVVDESIPLFEGQTP